MSRVRVPSSSNRIVRSSHSHILPQLPTDPEAPFHAWLDGAPLPVHMSGVALQAACAAGSPSGAASVTQLSVSLPNSGACLPTWRLAASEACGFRLLGTRTPAAMRCRGTLSAAPPGVHPALLQPCVVPAAQHSPKRTPIFSVSWLRI